MATSTQPSEASPPHSLSSPRTLREEHDAPSPPGSAPWNVGSPIRTAELRPRLSAHLRPSSTTPKVTPGDWLNWREELGSREEQRKRGVILSSLSMLKENMASAVPLFTTEKELRHAAAVTIQRAWRTYFARNRPEFHITQPISAYDMMKQWREKFGHQVRPVLPPSHPRLAIRC